MLTKGTSHDSVKALKTTGSCRRLSFMWDLIRDTTPAFVDALVKILEITAPALMDMKPSVVAQFSERTRVNPDVKYFTWAGDCVIETPLYG